MEKNGAEGGVPQGVNLGVPGGSAKGGRSSLLTKERKEVLALLQKGLSVAEAAKERNTSERAVRKTRTWLVNNHYWKGVPQGVPQGVPVQGRGGSAGRYRVHDFILSLPIHSGSERYFRMLKSGNIRKRDDHHIQLYPKNVTIRAAREFSFYGVDSDDAMVKAHEYWAGFIRRVEQWYNILLLKHDSIFKMSYEVAETDNDLAEQQAKKKDWIRVRTTEDGKTWLLFDASQSYEADTTHGVTAGDDMQRIIAPYFNNIRDNGHALRLPSEAWRMHDVLTGDVNALVSTVGVMVQAHASETAKLNSLFSLVGEQMKAKTPSVPSSEVVYPMEWLI